jgi:hypothetical protein
MGPGIDRRPQKRLVEHPSGPDLEAGSVGHLVTVQS